MKAELVQEILDLTQLIASDGRLPILTRIKAIRIMDKVNGYKTESEERPQP